MTWNIIEDQLHIETFEEIRPRDGKALRKRVYSIDIPSPDVLIFIVLHEWEGVRIIRTRDYYERISTLPFNGIAV